MRLYPKTTRLERAGVYTKRAYNRDKRLYNMYYKRSFWTLAEYDRLSHKLYTLDINIRCVNRNISEAMDELHSSYYHLSESALKSYIEGLKQDKEKTGAEYLIVSSQVINAQRLHHKNLAGMEKHTSFNTINKHRRTFNFNK